MENWEEPKYSDSEKKRKTNRSYNFRSTSARAKIENKKKGIEGNTNPELTQQKNSDINNRNVCPLFNIPVKTEVECGMYRRWFHYRCEVTTVKREVKEFSDETHYICKKEKARNQRVATIMELRKQLQKEDESRTKVEVVSKRFMNPPKKKITYSKQKS